MVDVAFALHGTTLPPDHRRLLADGVQRVLPWFGGTPGTGLHRLNVARSDTAGDLLSRRTRLVLRVPRERAADAAALAGAELDLGGHRVALGSPQPRELLAYGTLYAHLVASDAADEGAFLAWLDGELRTLGVSARAICGRWQSVEAHALAGCSLMLDGLGREASLRVLERGVGRHRRLGCGLFVPHKSAAAVGAPD